jgi:hypothetical protein
MVNSDGQLFTIEGVAAGLIMLFSAYLVVSATSIYTPGDTHISDMQLEQLGSDALRMMNTPNTTATTGESLLQNITKNNDGVRFKETFLTFCNSTTGGSYDNLQISADLFYRDTLTNSVKQFHFAHSRNLTGGEHAVRVTGWVHLDLTGGGSPLSVAAPGIDPRVQAGLMEVLLWRD